MLQNIEVLDMLISIVEYADIGNFKTEDNISKFLVYKNGAAAVAVLLLPTTGSTSLVPGALSPAGPWMLLVLATQEILRAPRPSYAKITACRTS